MIGIIGAMDVEVDTLKGDMQDAVTEVISGIEFVSGRLYGEDAVVARCGIGKVFAAACAQAMIIKYAPCAVINTGVAGSLSSELSIGDIVIADAVVQHDMDTSAMGDPVGMIPGIDKIRIDADEKLSDRLFQAVSAVGIGCARGTVASGDKFIALESDKDFIRTNFKALCCEMEGAAIGQVCFANGIPFAVVRAISDNADGSSFVDYPTFVKTASANSCKVIKEAFKG